MKEKNIYKEYKIENKLILEGNKKEQEENLYKKTKAYQDFVLKASKSLMVGEKLFEVITESEFKKQTNKIKLISKEPIDLEKHPYDGMTVFEKWYFLVFGKNLRE